jgi:hypothetical protein
VAPAVLKDRAGPAGGRIEVRVLPQDGLLEVLKLAGRLQAELLGERASRVPVARKRVGLTTRAVQREHELRAQALAGGVLPGERLELRDQSGVAAKRQVGLDALLERCLPKLVEARDRALRELLVGEVAQSGTAPQVECVAQEIAGA